LIIQEKKNKFSVNLKLFFFIDLKDFDDTKSNVSKPNDLGLDYTPVRDFKNKNSDDMKLFRERFNNLNIKPVEVDNFLPPTNSVLVNRRIQNITQDNHPSVNSSDTDTSIQAKCCANPFKW
jgi:hypothetical protein